MVKLANFESVLKLAPEPKEEPKSKGWGFIHMPTWLAQPYSEPDWLLEGLVPSDARVLISGRPKLAKKTCVAMAMGLAIATGERIGPFSPKAASKVCFLEAEDTFPLLRDRWLAMACGLLPDFKGDPFENLYISHRENVLLDDAVWMEKIKDALLESKAKFFVIDTLARHMSGDENAVKDMSKWLRGLTDIVPVGTTACILHHTGKESPHERDIDDELRGSSALAGAYDVHFAIRPEKGEYRAMTVRGKAFEDKQYTIDWYFDPGCTTMKMIPATKEGKAAGQREYLLEQMAYNAEYSLKRISEILHGITLKEAEIIALSLVKDGLVTQNGKGFCLTLQSEVA